MDRGALKVLVLPRYARKGASSRLRFYQFIPELEQRGMRVTVAPLLDDVYLEARYAGRKPSLWRLARAYMRRMGILLSVHRFDLVWMEKELFPLLPALGETLLSWIGSNYVVDYDDATFHSYELHSNPLVRYLLRSKIDTVMRRAHVVVAGNAYLAARARKAGAARIVEIPTLVDLDRYDLHPKASDAPFTIGWIGSPATANYLDLIRPALAKFSNQRDVRVVLIGSGPIDLPGVEFEVVDWAEETEVANLANFDVGVAPLEDGPWERGKCGYRILQYMASRLPVVASPVGVAKEVIEPGVSGFLAETTEQWIHALEKLRTDSVMRARMGTAGRARVESLYSTAARRPELHHLLREAAADSKARAASAVARSSVRRLARRWEPLHRRWARARPRIASREILVVVPGLGIGGTERHLTGILPRLRRGRFQVRVYYLLRGQNTLAQILESGDVPVIAPPGGRFLQYLSVRYQPFFGITMAGFKLLWILIKTRPAVVHSYLPLANIVSGICCLLAMPPACVMSRRSLNVYQKKHPLAARIERWLQARVNAVLGNSRAILRELREEGVEESRLGLIYNGVDLAPFDTLPTKQSARASLGKSETALVLIVVANLIAYKGHADLLRALATIAGKLPEDWVLLCVGRDDGIGKTLREQASDLELEEHIVWMGERQDVPHILPAADIGIMCSHEEGLSNSLLEGMAAGLPMVVTDVGGNRESVSDEITGLLVPPRNPIALGRAILDLAWAKPKRTAMGRAGRQHVETEFGFDSCVTQHERLYEGLVKGLSGSIREILDSRY